MLNEKYMTGLFNYYNPTLERGKETHREIKNILFGLYSDQ